MICANTKCKWHGGEGGGCRLFNGRSWESCRQSIKSATAKPSVKTPRKGQAK